jgi:pyruvate,orthophosphate dikinase
MLGHRGCRLGISYPEITEMQARAIFEAACDAAERGVKVEPEVMIPLVGEKRELDDQAATVRRVAAEVFGARGRADLEHWPERPAFAGSVAGSAAAGLHAETRAL